MRAGPWVKYGSLGQEHTGRIPKIVSIDGRRPVAIEHRNGGLVRVLFEKPSDDREPIPSGIGCMPEYVWDGAP